MSRNNCSDIKHDIFINHGSNTDICDVLLMSNTRFSVERHELFTATTGVHPVNSRNFLFGNKDLLLETNILIVNTVHVHIIILGIQRFFLL